MKTSIIIARYKEDINWITEIHSLFDTIYIYNKSDEDKNEILKNIEQVIIKKIVYEQLQNVGREGHTYLHHILKHRETLEDKLIFTQAEPFDHLVKRQYVEPKFFFNKCVNYLHTNKDFEGFGGKHYIWYVGLGGKRNDILKDMHGKLFKNQFVEEYKFNNGGIFGVTKDAIINRSEQFYKEIYNTPMSTHVNPHEGFVLERLWVLIFNKKYIAKHKQTKIKHIPLS